MSDLADELSYSSMIADTLISDEVWAEAPENNDAAFMFIALQAYARLKQLETDESARGLHSLGDWRKQYIYEVSTVAEQLGVQGLPDASAAAQNANTMADFDARLARIITRIRASNRADLRAESVKLSYQTKESIKEHLEALRAKINNSNLSPERQAALHKKIDAVEAELNKTRASLHPFWRLAGAVSLAGATALSALADGPDAMDTVNKVLQLVHIEKAFEENGDTLRLHPRIGHVGAMNTTDTEPLKLDLKSKRGTTALTHRSTS